ncbi:hypothetical protein [Bremerella cremea]|uniref:hypothetical protein n=1 Tax=Bremerella cremea TaxID=1031537 RepID=UPI0031EE5810
MHTAAILKTVCLQLRQRWGWTADQCRVTLDARPIARCGEFFVAIADAGTEAAESTGHFVAERFQLEVGVWRRVAAFPADRAANLLLEDDPHAAPVCLPHALERQVKQTIHRSYTLLNAINQAAGCGTEATGSGLQSPFVYRGSRRTQVLEAKPGGAAFVGRLIQFGEALHIDPISENEA